jgi:hypothetical protein
MRTFFRAPWLRQRCRAEKRSAFRQAGDDKKVKYASLFRPISACPLTTA